MLTEIRQIIRKDRRLQWLLFAGLLVQLVVCIKAIGFSNWDQHFTIIEFSSWQLGNENSAKYVYELDHVVKSSIQVHLFSAYYSVCQYIHISDPYLQLTILRVIMGLLLFGAFNLMSICYFRNESQRKVLYAVLLLLNFSWIFPYTRTLYSSEMLSSLFFFGAIFLYDLKKDKKPRFLFLAFLGFLLSLSFYFRFQAGFFIAGFGLWMLVFEKRYRNLIPLAIGFFIGVALNVYLDYRFYGEWAFTPYTYFERNIIQDKASEYGTSSVLKYIGLLIAVLPAPPFSLILYYYGLKAFVKKYKEPIYLAVVLFIAGHFLVGHKEERFLYPVFNVLPIIIGWGLADFFSYYERCRKWIAGLIRSLLILTVFINFFLLVLFTFNPYSQTVYFSYKLKNKFGTTPATIYCLVRSPLEMESGTPMTFYKKGIPNLELKKITYNDSVRMLTGHDILVATTFNQVKKDRSMFDSLGYKPVAYSSKLLWRVNEYLDSKHLNTINDIWVLYKKE